MSDWVPHHAEIADDIAVIRSCVSDGINHSGGVCQMNTGSVLAGRPSLGAWVTYGLGSESQDLPGFVPGPGGQITTCTSPSVTVTYSRSETAPGANIKYPLVTVAVTTALDFDLLVPWPMLPDGAWGLGTTQSFSIMQGR
jgi:hypothetical protein